MKGKDLEVGSIYSLVELSRGSSTGGHSCIVFFLKKKTFQVVDCPPALLFTQAAWGIGAGEVCSGRYLAMYIVELSS